MNVARDCSKRGSTKLFFDQPKRSSSAVLSVLGRVNGLEQARLGLIVSKKTEKTAVGRNRVKRLIRESFRAYQRQLAGVDIVVMAKRGISEKKNNEIFDDLSRHWKTLARCTRS